MAASMMLPGLFAGALQEAIGYPWFFTIVMISCLATAVAVQLVRRRIPDNFGAK